MKLQSLLSTFVPWRNLLGARNRPLSLSNHGMSSGGSRLAAGKQAQTLFSANPTALPKT